MVAAAVLAVAVKLGEWLPASLPDAGYGRAKGGLLLSLALPRTVLHVGEPMPARVEAVNLGTRLPVQATFCSPFGFSFERLGAFAVGYAGRPPPVCETDPFHDADRPFRSGQSLTVSVPDTGLDLEPGRYLVRANWTAYVIGDRIPLPHKGYAAVGSNSVLVTVLAR